MNPYQSNNNDLDEPNDQSWEIIPLIRHSRVLFVIGIIFGGLVLLCEWLSRIIS